ncbi:hypothetical protein POM88_029539 [Heracleum sosnowskyi]|uniref:Uncharacterized protein n=1 Tax=Heracleum sosnowskyi TaxID=360622 RepID=A0AAD8HV25_9APIA|nr:hypothetical protein POM88_029539 [Heracleum sosnowskyi]
MYGQCESLALPSTLANVGLSKEYVLLLNTCTNDNSNTAYHKVSAVYEVSESCKSNSTNPFCKSNSPNPFCKSNRRIARQRKQSMLVNFLLKRKMTFFIWTLGLCWEAEVANSGNTSNNHLRDTEHQPNRAMRLLFSNVYPPTQIQECCSSKEQKKKKYIRKMYDFIQQGKHAEKRKLEQAAMSKLIEMAYKKQRCVASHPDTRMLFLKGHHLWIIILQCVASHPDTRMLFLKEAREHYQQNNWVYEMTQELVMP